ncbi:hypothetical protein BT69DRAFT_1323993, partial [Atractiella rhizophila]
MSSFELEILQQPLQARQTGFGEKDRRPVDPPPVVIVRMKDEKGNVLPDNTVESDTLFCHAELFSPPASPSGSTEGSSSSTGSEPQQQNHIFPPTSAAARTSDAPQRPIKNFLGSLTVPGKRLKDAYGEYGFMFVFSDLAVRAEGVFSIRFTLVDLSTAEENGVHPPLSRVHSQAFRVFSHLTFPGMKSSTQALAKQGVKLIIRRNSGGRQGKSAKQKSTTVDGLEEGDDVD